jgi:hypothetical protein
MNLVAAPRRRDVRAVYTDEVRASGGPLRDGRSDSVAIGSLETTFIGSLPSGGFLPARVCLRQLQQELFPPRP